MSEATYESRVEETIKAEIAGSARVVEVATKAALQRAKPDEEYPREGFIDLLILAASVRVINILEPRMRRPLRRIKV